MDDVVYLDGAATREARAAPSLRQPVLEKPASHFVSLGAVLRCLLPKIEQRMNENAITNP